MSAAPLPEVTPLTEPYWNGLAEGRLLHQRCSVCLHAWLPAREECPRCLAANPGWVQSAGTGRLISWVVYRQPLHAYFADRVPYTVAVIELAEGPRLIGSLSGDNPAIEAPVRFRPVDVEGFAVASFALVTD
ncbi:OB-fold domain-containing protein [Nocardia sp. NPDC005745]|uniref:Zn-ribbon domain-containing OB-fold protein n=1 Tax=Nocardia sp. NPDC005745 TaxID=3157061 RepID=UPI003408293B